MPCLDLTKYHLGLQVRVKKSTVIHRFKENINLIFFLIFCLDNLFKLFAFQFWAVVLKLHQTLEVKNIFKQEKIMLQLILGLGQH